MFWTSPRFHRARQNFDVLQHMGTHVLSQISDPMHLAFSVSHSVCSGARWLELCCCALGRLDPFCFPLPSHTACPSHSCCCSCCCSCCSSSPFPLLQAMFHFSSALSNISAFGSQVRDGKEGGGRGLGRCVMLGREMGRARRRPRKQTHGYRHKRTEQSTKQQGKQQGKQEQAHRHTGTHPHA